MAHLPDESDSPSAPLPVRTRHQSASACLSTCFGRAASGDEAAPSPKTPSRSPSSWFRSKATDLVTCGSFVSNVGKRRHHSSDFKYDPLSYALNFDEGSGEDSPMASADDIRYRGFSARLPASPPSSRFPPSQPN